MPHSIHGPWANLSDIRDKILPERQSAPNEPHGYDMMGQTHDVLIEPGGRTDRTSSTALRLQGTLKLGTQLDSPLQEARTGPWLGRGTQGSQTYLEGLVYGREMANTLAYCSAAKFL